MTDSAADNEPRRGSTVPPRGGRKPPPRPSGRSSSRPGGANRTATNRRAAVAEARRRRQTQYAFGGIGLVIIIVAVVVIIAVAGGGKSPTASKAASDAIPLNTPVTASQYAQYTSPSVASLAAAANNYHDPPYLVGPTSISGPPTVKGGGIPHILYIGAEYCPYCATERWAMVLALSKFGTFSGLNIIHSSPTDVYPNTPTWSFYKSSYSSRYLVFTPVEETTVSKKPLQTPTTAELTLADKYDSGGSIPFVYLDGKATIVGAEFDPQLLAGKTFPEVVADVHAGSSTLSSNIYANAGMIISDLCRVTKGQPGNVCSYFPKSIT